MVVSCFTAICCSYATSQSRLLIVYKHVDIVGAAYSGVETEIHQLITRNGLPFLPTPMGKGVVTDDHPLCVGPARSR